MASGEGTEIRKKTWAGKAVFLFVCLFSKKKKVVLDNLRRYQMAWKIIWEKHCERDQGLVPYLQQQSKTELRKREEVSWSPEKES